jgi:plasmid stabilization system protein ParE
MTFQVVVTAEAIKSIDDMFAYIAADNPPAAAKLVAEFGKNIRSLRRMPKRCPVAPEQDVLDLPDVRHLIHNHYRIVFAVEGKTVVILEVRHSARLPMEK